MWSPHDHTGVRCMCEVIWKMLQHVGLDKRQWFVKVLVTTTVTTTMWCHIGSNTVSVQYMDSYGKYIYMNIMNNQQDILGQTAISLCSCQSQVGTNPLHSPSLFFFYTTLSYIIYICRLTYKLHWKKKHLIFISSPSHFNLRTTVLEWTETTHMLLSRCPPPVTESWPQTKASLL